MTPRSTIKNGLRTLVASLFAACLLAAWPLSANAKGNNSSRAQFHDITITHKYDKASPVLAKKEGGGNVSGGWDVKQNTAAAKKTGATKGKGQQYMKYEMKNVYISQ